MKKQIVTHCIGDYAVLSRFLNERIREGYVVHSITRTSDFAKLGGSAYIIIFEEQQAKEDTNA